MKKIIVIFLLIVVSQSVFSQSQKIATTTTSTSEVIYTPSSGPVVEQIVKNITQSRKSGDITNQRYWEGKLNDITKPQVIKGNPNAFNVVKNNEQQSQVETLNITNLANSVVQGNSISRERVTGHIYAAIGVYGGANPDTLKVYRSNNNGLNFDLILTLTQATFKISDNGLDVEAVSNGDSSYAFIGINYNLSGIYSSSIVRIRQDGAMYSVANVSGNSIKRYGKGRLTSDNAAFTYNTYVYLSLTLDSTVAGGRRLIQKLFKSEAPFSPNFNLISGYQNASFQGAYGYSPSNIAPDSAKLETDIAFVSTVGGSDHLYTVTIVRGIPDLFGNGTYLCFTKSTTYGSTEPSLFDYRSDDKLKESPRFAATGYLNNSALVVTRRLFAGGDWDPSYYYSADISAETPMFTSGFVESSGDTTIAVSVAAMYRSIGTYLFAFNNKRGATSSIIYTKSFNNGTLGALVQANPSDIPGTQLWGSPDASFRNVNNDSCLVIWSGSVGYRTFVTGGCSGPFIGIGSNSSIADGYSLSQNYPNPFNPSTVINFSLPVKSFVTIKVYDVNGKEIAELINEEKQMGAHSIEFKGTNLSSGVYYYKLTAGDFSQVRKMILVK